MVSTCQVFFRRAMPLPKVPVISIAEKGWNAKKKKILWARDKVVSIKPDLSRHGYSNLSW
jgi:hypothetical protein